MKRYHVRFAEVGIFIGDFETPIETKEMISLFEDEDKHNGDYESGAYEFFDSIEQEIVY